MPAKYDYVAAQVYVWMQSFRSQGLQLEDYLEAVFDEIKAANIDHIEGWLHWFEDAAQTTRIRTALTQRGMTLPSVYCNARLHDPAATSASIERVIKLAARVRDVGCEMIVLNPEPLDWNHPLEKSDAELQTQAAALNTIGEALQQAGMRLVVHHHDSEMRHNAREFYHVLEHTDAKTVGICLDFDWILRGGQSPLTVLQAVGSCLANIHLRNGRDGRWTHALGPGDIDYHAIHTSLNNLNYQGPLVIELVYEPDILPATSIGDHLQTSRDYVQSVFGV